MVSSTVIPQMGSLIVSVVLVMGRWLQVKVFRRWVGLLAVVAVIAVIHVVVGVAGTVATGRGEDGGEERQRRQRRPKPFRFCDRDDSTDERVFHFHNFALLSDW